jgi:glutathione S-transferase
MQWLFAALNSIEPHIQQLALIDGVYHDEEWAKLRRPGLVEFAERRLDALAGRLGEKDYLEGTFTGGDLMMTTVLRMVRGTPLLAARPALAAYVERCQARPAFAKALEAQLRPFAEHAPPQAA